MQLVKTCSASMLSGPISRRCMMILERLLRIASCADGKLPGFSENTSVSQEVVMQSRGSSLRSVERTSRTPTVITHSTHLQETLSSIGSFLIQRKLVGADCEKEDQPRRRKEKWGGGDAAYLSLRWRQDGTDKSLEPGDGLGEGRDWEGGHERSYVRKWDGGGSGGKQAGMLRAKTTGSANHGC